MVIPQLLVYSWSRMEIQNEFGCKVIASPELVSFVIQIGPQNYAPRN